MLLPLLLPLLLMLLRACSFYPTPLAAATPALSLLSTTATTMTSTIACGVGLETQRPRGNKQCKRTRRILHNIPPDPIEHITAPIPNTHSSLVALPVITVTLLNLSKGNP